MPITRSQPLAVALLLLLYTAYFNAAWAAQTFRVKDGDTVTVDVSARELTRIAVFRGGRLDKVYGAAGLLEVQPDMERGEVYIRPLPGAPAVFSFFARDESGGTYTIVATQRDIPSETVILEPAELRKLMLSSESDRSIPLVDRVKDLMKGMANNEEIEGYYRQSVDQIVPLWHETTIRLETYYETIDLFGEIYSIENVSPQVMSFHESEFMEFGDKVLAVALDTLALEPGKSTRLYVVRRSSEAVN